MKILEEFWYGNIEPAEYDTSGAEYKKALQRVIQSEEKLLATLTDEQKKLFTMDTEMSAMTFIWNDWKNTPVSIRGYSGETATFISKEHGWQEVTAVIPAASEVRNSFGSYEYSDGSIYLVRSGGEKELLTSEFREISGIGLSADKWLLYVTDQADRMTYFMQVDENGKLHRTRKSAPLMISGHVKNYGANSMCMDHIGRRYVATDAGVQIIGATNCYSSNFTQVILNLPGDLPAHEIALEGNTLYVRSGERIFTRQLNVASEGINDELRKPFDGTSHGSSDMPPKNGGLSGQGMFYIDAKYLLPKHPFIAKRAD